MKLLLFLILTGCAGIEQVKPEKALGGGAVSGAVAVKTVEKIKEVFTPEYRLLFEPIEICSIGSENGITCFLVPCLEGEESCTIRYQKDEWLESNSKVLTLRTSSLTNIKLFCEKNKDACEYYKGYYSGSKIVLLEDK